MIEISIAIQQSTYTNYLQKIHYLKQKASKIWFENHNLFINDIAGFALIRDQRP